MGWVDGLGLAIWFVVAEALAVYGAALEIALETHSRSTLLEQAEDESAVVAEMRHYGAHRLDARLLRFIGNALLVACIAWFAFRDGIGAEAGRIPWTRVAGIVGVTFGITFLVNEIVLGWLARREPERFLLSRMKTLRVLRAVLAPIRWPLVTLVHLLFRVDLDGAVQTARQDVLDSVEEGEREGSLTPSEADMIESIIDLGASTVRSVMTPRGEMVMFQQDVSIDEAIRRIGEDGVSRVPVYGSDKDDVLGVLYARDILGHWRDPRAREDDEATSLKVRSVMRPAPFFVPESKGVGDLLAEMRQGQVHMAIVVDEYGGTSGLVTIEDLLEEIVGEIRDEYDDDEVEEEAALARATSDPEGPMDVEGRTAISEVNRALDIELPMDEDFETMGGLVFHQLGNVPDVGTSLEVDGVKLVVLDADDRTVKRVRVSRR